MAGAAAILMTACGGGGSSSDPVVDPIVDPIQTYNTLGDLEFKTLNFTEYWHVLDSYLYSTIRFANNYIYATDGTPLLVDELSSTIITSACQIAPVELGTTYMCLRVFDSGAGAGYAINIDSSGSITGNYEYSATGDATEIVIGLLDRDLADAWITGTVSSNVATTKTMKISNTIDNQAKLSEYDSIIPQPIKQQSNTNSETVQKIDEMFNLLMLKDEL